jgi:hypothetical protein
VSCKFLQSCDFFDHPLSNERSRAERYARRLVRRSTGSPWKLDSGKLRPAAVQGSSDGLWKGIRLEHVYVPGEISEGYLLRHAIALHLSSPITIERYWPGRGWKPQRFTTWSIQVFPARVPFASRWNVDAKVLLLEVTPELTETMRALKDDIRAGSPALSPNGE